MRNILKMDLYRMFRSKSLYVIWIIMALILTFTTYLEMSLLEEDEGSYVLYEEEGVFEESDELIIGIEVGRATEPGAQASVYDYFYVNSQGSFYVMFLLIFAVIFSTADMKSGYIKNIGGQIRDRKQLILSKAAALLICTICTLMGMFFLQAMINRLLYGYLAWGDWNKILRYMPTTILLHLAFLVLIMAIAIILKNNTVSMVFAMCYIMGIWSQIYALLDHLLEKIGIRNVVVYEYLLPGKLSMLSANPSVKECIIASLTAGIYIVISVVICSVVFEKRDI